MTELKHGLVVTLVLALAFSLFPGCGPKEAPPAPREPSQAPVEQPAAPPAEAALPADTGDPIAVMKEPPAMPKGYGSTPEVMIAIGKGEIELLDENVKPPEDVKELAGIEYCNIDGISLKLDLALPAEAKGPLPGLIFIHGGAWASGEREIYHLYTYKFAQQGYAAATISYRLAGQAKFPAAVQDVKCAVRWMRANAATYGIDPDHIAVLGGSAGGHLAMMVGYTSDVPEFEGEGGNPGVSSAVQAVVNFYGPYDLTAEIAQNSDDVKGFLGVTYEENPDLYLKASPMNYLNAGDPPTLIFHGTIDEVVPVEQSERLAARLGELGIPYTFERFEGWPHTMDLAKAVNERCRWFMYRFFEEHLSLEPAAPAGAAQ
ncbi:MAG TPA: alpha/beta hydrolase [Candidatus Hydrogenedentes bacterium]|nr:alpha/beta hydrolase [Candidatus Hydrogenedentota bacterium]